MLSWVLYCGLMVFAKICFMVDGFSCVVVLGFWTAANFGDFDCCSLIRRFLCLCFDLLDCVLCGV